MNSRKLDQSLWNEIRAGSEQDFSDLFFRYSDLLLNYGCLVVKDRELIKDGMQELFLDIWRRREALPEAVNVKHYLIKAFRRVLLRRIQQDGRRRLDPSPYPDLTDTCCEDHITEAETTYMQQSYLAGKINELPPRQKEIVYLKYYQDLSYEEICEIMGIRQQAAWNLISRAIKTLRTLVADRQLQVGSLVLVLLIG